MEVKVRYCSKTKFGNTRRIAEVIADGVYGTPESIYKIKKLF